MTATKLYAFNALCPKCREEAGQRWFCKGCKAVAQPEHLHSMCRVCGYDWLARCADDSTVKKSKDKKPGGGKPNDTAQ